MTSPRQRGDDLRIGDLAKVRVPLADSPQLRRRNQTDYLIRLATQARKGVWRTDRDREDQAPGPMTADLSQRGGVGNAGRHAVVNDDDDAITRAGRFAVAPISLNAAPQLGALALDDAGQLTAVDLQQRQRLLIEDLGAALGDRADSVLGIVRSAELTHSEELEWCPQQHRDLLGHRDAAAGQADDQRTLVGQPEQSRRQLAPRVGTVREGTWRIPQSHVRLYPDSGIGMRLLVGFDGSNGGYDALELARAIAAADDQASVLVVLVKPYGPLPAASEALASDASAEAEAYFDEARERLGGFRVETRAFGGGSPAKVMTELAEGERIDLIVVGSPHRGAIGRTLIGSVGDSLLHGSPRPVVVAPRGYAGERHEPFRRIAVGHDGTPEADAALRAAEALALRSNALIDVLTVLAPPAATPGPAGYAPIDPPEPDKILNQAIHSVDERLGATGRRLDGPPARILAGACEEADLLVVGSRGYGPVLRVLLGSVSTRLIHIAPCPVLVIPRPGGGG